MRRLATPGTSSNMRDSGYGVLLMIGLVLGLGVGVVVGEPSAGVVIGLGVGGLLALGLRFRNR
jgi:hypothetical protein